MRLQPKLDPELAERFKKACDRVQHNHNDMTRALIAALVDYLEKHEHLSFPIAIVSQKELDDLHENPAPEPTTFPDPPRTHDSALNDRAQKNK